MCTHTHTHGYMRVHMHMCAHTRTLSVSGLQSSITLQSFKYLSDSSGQKWKCGHWPVTNANDIKQPPSHLDPLAKLLGIVRMRNITYSPEAAHRLRKHRRGSTSVCIGVLFFSGKMIHIFNQHLREVVHPKRPRATLSDKRGSTSLRVCATYSELLLQKGGVAYPAALWAHTALRSPGQAGAEGLAGLGLCKPRTQSVTPLGDHPTWVLHLPFLPGPVDGAQEPCHILCMREMEGGGGATGYRGFWSQERPWLFLSAHQSLTRTPGLLNQPEDHAQRHLGTCSQELATGAQKGQEPSESS